MRLAPSLLIAVALLSSVALAAGVEERSLPGGVVVLELVSGGDQTAATSAAFALPVVVRVVDGFGVALPNETVHFGVLGDGIAADATALSDGLGMVQTTVTAGSVPGSIALLAGHASGASLTVDLDVTAQRFLFAVSGFGQSAAAMSTFPTPIAVRVEDVFGQVEAGVAVTFSAANGGSFLPAATVTTGADGIAQVQFVAGSVPGPTAVAASAPGAAPSALLFPLGVDPSSQLTPVSGDGQSATIGRPLPAPLGVQVDDLSGNPRIGATVHFHTVTSSGTFALGSAVTDATGLAQLAVTVPIGGELTVHAWSDGAAMPGVAFAIFGRELHVMMVSDDFVAITYEHEHGPVPLILAVDAPPAVPLSTPWGAVWTSVLAPSAELMVMDGIGIFEPANPSVVANPDYVYFATVPPQIVGTQRVLQIYGYDAAYAWPDCLIVSNEVICQF